MDPSSPTDDTRPTPQHDAKLERAKKQVAAIKGFYIHSFVFVVVMVGLFVLNLALKYWADSPWWVQWPLLGWGIAVGAHAFAVFGHASKRVADWEERKIRQLMEEK
jgi:2TM domain